MARHEESFEMATFLIRKLERFVHLSEVEKAALGRLSSQNIKSYGNREDIVCEGDRPRVVNIILDGMAYRYKVLEDGRRQIIGFFTPGDICDPRVFILREMDHSIATLGPMQVAEVTEDAMIELMGASAKVSQAMWWSTMVEEAIAREWIMNIGQRTATERMAHLLCELFLRMRAVGLTEGSGVDLPMTQTELADALGMSAVHTNRTLQDLRAEKLIVWKGKRLIIPNLQSLQAIAMFNPNYLHLNEDGENAHRSR
jgi:CRP-like cAMP-binding protein